MIQNSQFCQIAGHEMLKITHICTYKQCQQATRFICQECNRKSIHIHEAQEKFMRLEDLQIYLDTKVKARIEQQKMEAQRIPQFIQDINQIIQQLQHVVEQQESYLFNLKEIGKAYELTNKKLLTLSNQQMNYLINIEDGNIDYFQTQNDLQKVISQLQNMNQECFSFTYSIHNVIKIQDISSLSISQNEQSLSFLADNRLLKINKLGSNQAVMNRIFSDDNWLAKFSSNSKFIFTSSLTGRFRQFFSKNNFKQIHSRQIDRDMHISDFIQIDSNEILSCSQKSIIYDYVKRRVLLKFNTDSWVYQSEYDKINNMIVLSLYNLTINFYDRNNGTLMISQSLGLENNYKIQLTNNSQNLLGSDGYSLKVWNIDYQNKKLNLIKELSHKVIFFTSVYSDSRIIIRSKTHLVVVDNNLNVIYKRQYEDQSLDNFCDFDQLQTMNYILCSGKQGELVILKNINQL